MAMLFGSYSMEKSLFWSGPVKSAEKLGMTDILVRKLAHKRDFAHFRIGNRVYFDMRDVLSYMHISTIREIPRPERVPGDKIMGVEEKFRIEIEITRFDACPHTFPHKNKRDNLAAFRKLEIAL